MQLGRKNCLIQKRTNVSICFCPVRGWLIDWLISTEWRHIHTSAEMLFLSVSCNAHRFFCGWYFFAVLFEVCSCYWIFAFVRVLGCVPWLTRSSEDLWMPASNVHWLIVHEQQINQIFYSFFPTSRATWRGLLYRHPVCFCLHTENRAMEICQRLHVVRSCSSINVSGDSIVQSRIQSSGVLDNTVHCWSSLLSTLTRSEWKGYSHRNWDWTIEVR